MAAHGANETVFSRFRGINLMVDPVELPEGHFADAVDLDFEGETAKRRYGRERYNSSGLGAEIQGISSFVSGTDRLLLVGVSTYVYADRGTDGTFAVGDRIATGLTGGSPMDFWIWRDQNIYFGNGVDAVRKSVGGGAASTVAPITAPASAATVSPKISAFEAFDSGAFTSTNANLTTAYDTTIRKEGTGCLQVTAATSAALNAFVYRLQSGATDLSQAEELVLWVQGNMTGLQFQVGVYDDTETTLSNGPTWGRFPTFTIREANVWTEIRVPLAGIKPSDRDNVPGIAVKFISDGGRGFTTDPVLYFDDAKLQGQMAADRYAYYYTYADTDGSGNVLRESAPSPVAYAELRKEAPYLGVDVTVTASGDGTVDQIRIYRRRDEGFWALEKLVKTGSNSSSTLSDLRADGEVDLDPLSVSLQHYRNAPPLAYTYCLSGRRLYCGDVTVSATRYRNRIYVSAFNDPESFSPSEQVNVIDPNAAGWLDLPKGEQIVRLVDFDGQVIIFTQRAVYSLSGDNWDLGSPSGFNLQLRAEAGLDGRWAVAVADRLIYFLSGDGVRVLAPNSSFDDSFPCWRIDEPVESELLSIPNGSFTGRMRAKVAFGIDERQRLHVSYSTSSTSNHVGLIFDPRIEGALTPGYQPLRPGWTRYSDWGFSVFHKLTWQAGDRGSLVGGEAGSGGYVNWVFYKYDGTVGGATLISASTVAWSLTTRALDAGYDRRVEVCYAGADADGTAQVAIVRERGASTTSEKALAAADRGRRVRFGAVVNPRVAQVKVSSDGTHTATELRALALGYYVR